MNTYLAHILGNKSADQLKKKRMISTIKSFTIDSQKYNPKSSQWLILRGGNLTVSEAETADSLAKISVLETETGDCFKVESLTKNLQYIIANGKYLAQSSIVLKDSHARIITIVVGDYKADTFLSSKIDISIERKLYWGLVLFRNLVNILVIASLILTCGFVVAFYVFKSQTQNFIQRENFDTAYDRLTTLQGMPYKYLFLVDKDLKNNLDSLVLNKIKPNSNYKLPLKFTNDFPIFINIHPKIEEFIVKINYFRITSPIGI